MASFTGCIGVVTLELLFGEPLSRKDPETTQQLLPTNLRSPQYSTPPQHILLLAKKKKRSFKLDWSHSLPFQTTQVVTQYGGLEGERAKRGWSEAENILNYKRKTKKKAKAKEFHTHYCLFFHGNTVCFSYFTRLTINL